MQGTEYWTQDTGHRTPDTGHRRLDTGQWTLETKNKTSDAAPHQTQDTGHLAENTEHRTQGTEHRPPMHDPGHKALNTGYVCQLLIAVCWLALLAGGRLLVSDTRCKAENYGALGTRHQTPNVGQKIQNQ